MFEGFIEGWKYNRMQVFTNITAKNRNTYFFFIFNIPYSLCTISQRNVRPHTFIATKGNECPYHDWQHHDLRIPCCPMLTYLFYNTTTKRISTDLQIIYIFILKKLNAYIAIEMTVNRLLQVAIYLLATLCMDAIKAQF